MFCAGLFVDCIKNTSCPLTFSLNFTHISPSEKVLKDISPNKQPWDSAILFAKSELLLPLNIFNLFSIFLIAGPQGLEPRLPGPKPGVLPLDDSPNALIQLNQLGRVITDWYLEENFDFAKIALASSLNIPNTVEPNPTDWHTMHHFQEVGF